MSSATESQKDEGLICVVYASSAKGEMSLADVCSLVVESRKRNEKAGITGVLLFHDGNFMQVIEGTRSAVIALQKKIYADPRHHKILTMLVEPIEERIFPDWPMGFPHWTAEGKVDLEAYLRLLEDYGRAVRPGGNASWVLTLLLSFRRMVR